MKLGYNTVVDTVAIDSIVKRIYCSNNDDGGDRAITKVVFLAVAETCSRVKPEAVHRPHLPDIFWEDATG